MKKKFLQEIDIELGMRRKVWEKIYGQSDKFVKIAHQERYDTLLAMRKLIEGMTDAEIIAKMNGTKPDDGQKSLF